MEVKKQDTNPDNYYRRYMVGGTLAYYHVDTETKKATRVAITTIPKNIIEQIQDLNVESSINEKYTARREKIGKMIIDCEKRLEELKVELNELGNVQQDELDKEMKKWETNKEKYLMNEGDKERKRIQKENDLKERSELREKQKREQKELELQRQAQEKLYNEKPELRQNDTAGMRALLELREFGIAEREHYDSWLATEQKESDVSKVNSLVRVVESAKLW